MQIPGNIAPYIPHLPKAQPGAAAAAGTPDSKQPLVSPGLIDQILDKGLFAWAEEQRRAELEARIRREVLSELGMTEEDLAKMGVSMRDRIEQQIAKIVRERLEAALREDLAAAGEKAAKAGGAARPSLDIMV